MHQGNDREEQLRRLQRHPISLRQNLVIWPYPLETRSVTKPPVTLSNWVVTQSSQWCYQSKVNLSPAPQVRPALSNQKASPF